MEIVILISELLGRFFEITFGDFLAHSMCSLKVNPCPFLLSGLLLSGLNNPTAASGIPYYLILSPARLYLCDAVYPHLTGMKLRLN